MLPVLKTSQPEGNTPFPPPRTRLSSRSVWFGPEAGLVGAGKLAQPQQEEEHRVGHREGHRAE